MHIINNKANRVVRPIIAGLFLSASLSSMAQGADADTTAMAKQLDEIVVQAPANIVVGNKRIFYPVKELKSATNSCVQLLAGLQIPELIVNPASGSVSLSGDNKLSIRINGRQVSEAELASISSKDITKVEYIDNPGVRYGDANGVLDITVKRHDGGYGVMLNILQSPNRGWGNYSAAFKYYLGKSEWMVDYSSNPMWDMDCYRDNYEHIISSDGISISRFEAGKKVPNRMVTHHASVQYSYADAGNLLLNVQARLLRRNDKNISEGDITTDIDGTSVIGFEREASLIKSWQADLDLYCFYKINNRNKLYLNIVPTIIDGSNSRSYLSSATTIDSEIDNSGSRLLAEAIWETRFAGGSLSSGLRSSYSYDKARYVLSDAIVKEVTLNNYIFSEWSQSLNNWQYAVGLGATLFSIFHPVSYSVSFLNPRISLRYKPADSSTLLLSLSTTTVPPSINQLNPVLQQVDSYQFSKGNIDLRPFQRCEQQLAYDFSYRNIYIKGRLSNRYANNPVMGEKHYEAGEIVGSFANAGFNNDFEINAMLRIPLFLTQLTLSVDGGWHSTVSKGLNYRHTYSQPFINAQLMYMSGPWWVMIKYNSSYNSLWGEMISSTNQNLLNIGVGYTYRKATFMAGIVNPFGNVALHSENLNAIAGYDRTYQASGSNQLVWVGFTLNLQQGKRRAKMQKKLDNSTIYESINNTMK